MLELLAAALVSVAFGAAGLALGLRLVTGPVAVASAVAACTALYTTLLVVRALRIHSAAESFGPCRGVGFMAMGVLAGGLSMTAAALDPERGSYLVAAGVAASAGLFLLGLLLLPGAAPTLMSRIRRVLDGLTIGFSFFLAGWTFVLVPLAHGDVGPIGLNVTTAVALLMVLSASLAVAVLTSVRAVAHRISALLCGAGVVVALVQHAAVALLLLVGAGWQTVLAAGALWGIGPVLIWIGARRSAAVTPRPRRDGSRRRLRFPATLSLLGGSSGLALLGSLYHLVAFGPWGVYTGILCATTATAVAVRGFFAALDVMRYTARLAAQQHRFVSTDPLTGLPNRARLRHRLEELRARVGVGRCCGMLLVVDLDDFGELDDIHGHDAGDAILLEAAGRLRALTGPDDLAVRLAGDSFAVLTTRPPQHAEPLAERLREGLAEPYRPTDTEPGVVHLTTSVGIAECNTAAGVDEMIRCAELAVSSAKQQGGDRVVPYDDALQLRVLRRRTFGTELRHAIGRRELDLLFTPVMDLTGGEPAGLRVRVRWLHPTLGEVSASELAEAARDTGLVATIGDWTLREAVRLLGRWVGEDRDLWASVPVTGAQLGTPGFPSTVYDLCREYGVAPGRLVLYASDRDLPVVRYGPALAALRDLGFGTGLADFGAGSASLFDLRELALDQLLLHESLLDDLAEWEPIVTTVVELAGRLSLTAVATGVAEPWQARLLASRGCRYATGPLYSHPVPAERVEAYLDTRPNDPPAPRARS